MFPDSIVYLSEADAAAMELDVTGVVAALEQCFRLQDAGKVFGEPKTSIWIGPGHGFQSLAIVDTDRHVAAMKWIGLVPPGNLATTNVNASIILSDTRTGTILAILDARRATALRTAAMTVAAAKRLARRDSADIGFIGAGVQARSHWRALATILPSLRHVRVSSASQASAVRFAGEVRASGLEADVVSGDRVLSESDVIVTTVPLSPGFAPFLDAGKVRPGSFVAAVDLGRSWIDHSLKAMDLTVIDDEGLRHGAKPGTFIPPLDAADATLGDLITRRHPGRTGSDQRAMFVSSGSAIADLAIGKLMYEQALASGIGIRLPR